MCAKRVSFRRDDRGATVVEFALLLPVLAAFLVGVLQVGWALHCAASVRWALEDAGRRLLISPQTSDTETARHLQIAMASLGPRNNQVEILVSREPGAVQTVAIVTAVYQHAFDIPLLPRVTTPFRASITIPLRP
ncbi:pilus assembly protein [Phenylobacterium sp. J426]|uniref:TadE/TadG family type IV pilus assembly protein n=1 Tax=Phenylobacterium sp. J426 TaxID=2898439 RepID=UPI002150799B|nr:TadE/TadG family type IV pilus assembly protein [Phenylobacterium sp. J426]MCR5876280.1 pilus assembly protein [Phenylobacterium sp. J426]